MKAYRFRLASVLRVRKAQEKAARAELVQAERQLQAAVAARRASEQDEPPVIDGIVPVEIHLALRAAQAASAASLRLALAREAALRGEVAAAGTQLRETAQRVAVLEHLDASSRAEHRAALLAAEAREADDLVASRHRSDPS